MKYSSRYKINDVIPDAYNPSYTSVDAGIYLSSPNQGWKLALVGRNLSDEYIQTRGTDAPSTGGGTGTVTIVTTTYLYLNNVTGTFTSGQVETITGGTSNATATLDTYTATVNRYLVNGVEGQSITLIDDNTYRLDTSDSTNANHPIAIGNALNGFLGRQYGTAGAAGSYYEFIVGPSVSSLSSTSYTSSVRKARSPCSPRCNSHKKMVQQLWKKSFIN